MNVTVKNEAGHRIARIVLDDNGTAHIREADGLKHIGHVEKRNGQWTATRPEHSDYESTEHRTRNDALTALVRNHDERTPAEPTVEQMTEGTLGGTALVESAAKAVVAKLTEKHGKNTANFERIIQTKSAENGTTIKPFGITMNVAAMSAIFDITELTDAELRAGVDEANRVLYIEIANMEIEREYITKTQMGVRMCQSRIDSWNHSKQLFKEEIARRVEANRPQTPTEQLVVGDQVAVTVWGDISTETKSTVAHVTDDYIEIDDAHRTRFNRETGCEVNTSRPRYIIVRADELPPLLALGDTVETVGQLHDLVVGSLVLDAHGYTYRLGFDKRLKPSIIAQNYLGQTDVYDFESVKGSTTALDGARVVFVPSK